MFKQDKFFTKPQITYNPKKVQKLFTLLQTLDTIELLQYSLSNQIPLSVSNDNGDSLIHEVLNLDDNIALEDTKFIIIDFLVNNDANPDKFNKSNQTPLHIACLKQYCTIVKYFIDIGCRIDATDLFGQSLYHYVLIGNLQLKNFNTKKKSFVVSKNNKYNDYIINDIVNNITINITDDHLIYKFINSILNLCSNIIQVDTAKYKLLTTTEINKNNLQSLILNDKKIIEDLLLNLLNNFSTLTCFEIHEKQIDSITLPTDILDDYLNFNDSSLHLTYNNTGIIKNGKLDVYFKNTIFSLKNMLYNVTLNNIKPVSSEYKQIKYYELFNFENAVVNDYENNVNFLNSYTNIYKNNIKHPLAMDNASPLINLEEEFYMGSLRNININFDNYENINDPEYNNYYYIQKLVNLNNIHSRNIFITFSLIHNVYEDVSIDILEDSSYESLIAIVSDIYSHIYDDIVLSRIGYDNDYITANVKNYTYKSYLYMYIITLFICLTDHTYLDKFKLHICAMNSFFCKWYNIYNTTVKSNLNQLGIWLFNMWCDLSCKLSPSNLTCIIPHNLLYISRSFDKNGLFVFEKYLHNYKPTLYNEIYKNISTVDYVNNNNFILLYIWILILYLHDISDYKNVFNDYFYNILNRIDDNLKNFINYNLNVYNLNINERISNKNNNIINNICIHIINRCNSMQHKILNKILVDTLYIIKNYIHDKIHLIYAGNNNNIKLLHKILPSSYFYNNVELETENNMEGISHNHFLIANFMGLSYHGIIAPIVNNKDTIYHQHNLISLKTTISNQSCVGTRNKYYVNNNFYEVVISSLHTVLPNKSLLKYNYTYPLNYIVTNTDKYTSLEMKGGSIFNNDSINDKYVYSTNEDKIVVDASYITRYTNPQILTLVLSSIYSNNIDILLNYLDKYLLDIFYNFKDVFIDRLVIYNIISEEIVNNINSTSYYDINLTLLHIDYIINIIKKSDIDVDLTNYIVNIFTIYGLIIKITKLAGNIIKSCNKTQIGENINYDIGLIIHNINDMVLEYNNQLNIANQLIVINNTLYVNIYNSDEYGYVLLPRHQQLYEGIVNYYNNFISCIHYLYFSPCYLCAIVNLYYNLIHLVERLLYRDNDIIINITNTILDNDFIIYNNKNFYIYIQNYLLYYLIVFDEIINIFSVDVSEYKRKYISYLDNIAHTLNEYNRKGIENVAVLLNFIDHFKQDIINIRPRMYIGNYPNEILRNYNYFNAIFNIDHITSIVYPIIIIYINTFHNEYNTYVTKYLYKHINIFNNPDNINRDIFNDEIIRNIDSINNKLSKLQLYTNLHYNLRDLPLSIPVNYCMEITFARNIYYYSNLIKANILLLVSTDDDIIKKEEYYKLNINIELINYYINKFKSIQNNLNFNIEIDKLISLYDTTTLLNKLFLYKNIANTPNIFDYINDIEVILKLVLPNSIYYDDTDTVYINTLNITVNNFSTIYDNFSDIILKQTEKMYLLNMYDNAIVKEIYNILIPKIIYDLHTEIINDKIKDIISNKIIKKYHPYGRQNTVIILCKSLEKYIKNMLVLSINNYVFNLYQKILYNNNIDDALKHETLNYIKNILSLDSVGSNKKCFNEVIFSDNDTNILYPNDVNNIKNITEYKELIIDINLVKLLIDKGVNPYIIDYNGNYCIHNMIKYNNYAVIKFMNENNIKYNTKELINSIKTKILSNLLKFNIINLNDTKYSFHNIFGNINIEFHNSIKSILESYEIQEEFMIKNYTCLFDVVTYITLQYISEWLLHFYNDNYTQTDLKNILSLCNLTNINDIKLPIVYTKIKSFNIDNVFDNYALNKEYSNNINDKNELLIEKIKLEKLLLSIDSSLPDSISIINKRIEELTKSINTFTQSNNLTNEKHDNILLSDILNSSIDNYNTYLNVNNSTIILLSWIKFMSITHTFNSNLFILEILKLQYDTINNTDTINKKNIECIALVSKHIFNLCNSYFVLDQYSESNKSLLFLKILTTYITKVFIGGSIEYILTDIIIKYYKDNYSRDDIYNILHKIKHIPYNKIKMTFMDYLYNVLCADIIENYSNIFDNKVDKDMFQQKSCIGLIENFIDLMNNNPIISEDLYILIKNNVPQYFDTFVVKTIELIRILVENIFRYFINNYKEIEILNQLLNN